MHIIALFFIVILNCSASELQFNLHPVKYDYFPRPDQITKIITDQAKAYNLEARQLNSSSATTVRNLTVFDIYIRYDQQLEVISLSIYLVEDVSGNRINSGTLDLCSTSDPAEVLNSFSSLLNIMLNLYQKID